MLSLKTRRGHDDVSVSQVEPKQVCVGLGVREDGIATHWAKMRLLRRGLGSPVADRRQRHTRLSGDLTVVGARRHEGTHSVSVFERSHEPCP